MAVQLRLVRDVVHRVDHEIHRHHVDPPALDAQRRHPWRQHFAQLLEEGEEVVRAVDLVHLAGLRVADHHARAVDPPLDAGLVADQAFGIVLGAQVGIVEALGLVEHVLAEDAGIQAGGGDRAGVVEAAHLQRRGQVQRVLGAVDVGRALAFRAGGHVVDRGQVEEMLDLLRRQRANLRCGQSALRRGHVAGHRDHPLRVPGHLLGEGVELLHRLLAHQHVDRALALEQVADQETAQEPGTAGDEIAHARSPCERQRARNAPCAPTLPEPAPANNSPAY